MANKPTQPVFPLGLETSEQSNLAGILNSGTIEHGPDAVLTFPEGSASPGLPSSVRYNAASDEFEGFYENGGWLPLGGGGIRWEVLPHASTATLTEGRGYLVDNTTDSSTVVFPSPTRVGDSVTVCDMYGKFSLYPLTIDPNGHPMYGSTEPMTLSTDSVSATFTWSGDARGWIVTAGVGLGQGRVYSRTIFTETVSVDTAQVTLATQPSIVDVYIDGKRLQESKYSLDGYNVNFSPSIPAYSEIQVIQYVPIQLGNVNGGTGGGTVITWIYNGGAAAGGETGIELDVDAEDVSEVFINGSRQQKSLGFNYDPSSKVITLADELDAGDEVIVVINGDPSLYNQIDRTPNEVARATNVPTSQVILTSDTITKLDGKTVLYDVVAQKIWAVPAGIPAGSSIVSVSGNILTYTPGNVAVQMSLVPLPLLVDFVNNLAASDGEKLIGKAATVAALRTIEPVADGQRITVREHTAGTGKGGGQFRAVMASSLVDNNGTIIKTTGGNAWLRVNAEVVNPLMFGAKADSVTDDSQAISRALAAANDCDLLGLTYGVAGTISLNADSNYLHNGNLFCIDAAANVLVRMRYTNQRIDKVTFDGNNKKNVYGIIWEGARTGVGGAITNCVFKYLGYSGITVSGDYTNRIFANSGIIRDCIFIECGHNGTANNRCSLLADGVNNFRIQGINIVKANWGIYVRMDTTLADKARAQDNMVLDCLIQGSGRNHATFTDAQGLSANRQENMKVHNMIIMDFADNAFDFGSGRGCHITNFRATACKDAIFIGDISCDRYVIDNVQAQSCDRALRIVMDGTIYPVENIRDIRISNMHAIDPIFAGFYIGNTGATTTVQRISLVNCTVDSTNSYSGSNYQYPFYIRGVQHLDMMNCCSLNAKTSAIFIDNSSDSISITGGRLLENNKSNTSTVYAIDVVNSHRVSIQGVDIIGGGSNTGAIRTASGTTGHRIQDNRDRSLGLATMYSLSTSANCYASNNASF